MVPALLEVFSDLRLAVRQVRKQPGMTLSVIVTLALGVEASMAVSSLLYEALLKSMRTQPGK